MFTKNTVLERKAYWAFVKVQQHWLRFSYIVIVKQEGNQTTHETTDFFSFFVTTVTTQANEINKYEKQNELLLLIKKWNVLDRIKSQILI